MMMCKEMLKISFNLLWIIELVFAIGISIWLINPISENMVLLLLLTIGWLFIATLRQPKNIKNIFLNKRYILTYIWLFVLFGYSIIGHSEYSFSYILLAICFSIGQYYIINKDINAALLIFISCISYYLIICIKTLEAYVDRPGVSRILANGDLDVIISRGGMDYLTPFVAGYDTIYGFVISASLFYYLGFSKETNRLTKYIFLTFAVIFSYLIFKSEYSFAVILLACGIIISYILNLKTDRDKILVMIFVGFILFLTIGFGQVMIEWIADKVPSVNYQVRLYELSSLLYGASVSTSSDIGTRMYLYGISISNFIETPIFGKGTGVLYDTYGNHSTFMDAFAKYGLVGAIPFIMYYFVPIDKMRSRLGEKESKSYNMITILFLLLMIFNRGDTRTNMCMMYILCPLVCFLHGVIGVKK